jgi:transcriptional regulator with XRE-family HTH domain
MANKRTKMIEWRKAKGWTLEIAAREFGLTSKGYLSDIENGGRCSVSAALTIERVTDGQILAHDLNPDVALVRSAA